MKLKDIFPRYLLREKSYGELELGGGSAFAHLTEDLSDNNWSGSGVEVNDDLNVLSSGATVHSIYASMDDYSAAVQMSSDGHVRVINGATGDSTLDIHPDGSIHLGSGAGVTDSYIRRRDPSGLELYGHGLGVAVTDEGGILVGADPDVPNLQVSLDGSLHWGDGTAAPNRSIKPLNRYEGDTGLIFDDPDSDGFVVGDIDGTQLRMSTYGLTFLTDGGDVTKSQYGPDGADVRGFIGAENVTVGPGGFLTVQSPDANIDREFGVGDDGHMVFANPIGRINARGKGFKLTEADGTVRTITVAGGELVVT